MNFCNCINLIRPLAFISYLIWPIKCRNKYFFKKLVPLSYRHRVNFVTVRTNYEKKLIKRNNFATFLYASLKLDPPLSFYVCFVLEKPARKKLKFFFNRSKVVLLTHCCFPCLASLDKEGTSKRQGQIYTREIRKIWRRETVVYKDRHIRLGLEY